MGIHSYQVGLDVLLVSTIIDSIIHVLRIEGSGVTAWLCKLALTIAGYIHVYHKSGEIF